jgi:hypothetical protein
MEIKMTADVLEVNRYDFTVEVDGNLPAAEAMEVAKTKLKTFLDTNCPDPYQQKPIDGVICYDRESGMSTEDIKSVDVDMTQTILNLNK